MNENDLKEWESNPEEFFTEEEIFFNLNNEKLKVISFLVIENFNYL